MARTERLLIEPIKNSQKKPEKELSGREKAAHLKSESALAIKDVDRILVHQHVVRRFKTRHPMWFDQLQILRSHLNHALHGMNQGRIISYGQSFQTAILCECMNFLMNPSHWADLASDQYEHLTLKLGEEIAIGLRLSSVDLIFNDNHLYDFLTVLAQRVQCVPAFPRDLPYFRYYSYFSMSSLVPGSKLYFHYLSAKRGQHKLREDKEDTRLTTYDDSLWLFTNESSADKDLSALVDTNTYEPVIKSANVQIFGGSQHTVSVNGTKLEDRLILSIPASETPHRIDEMLDEFRRAFRSEYTKRHRRRINDSEFNRSLFWTGFTHAPCLINGWDQVQPYLTGLWAWDTKNDIHGVTVDSACQQVSQEMVAVHTAVGGIRAPYSETTIRKHYEKTTREIGSNMGNKSKPTQLDRFLIGSDEVAV